DGTGRALSRARHLPARGDPGAPPPMRHVQEGWLYPVALPDGVAGGAPRPEQIGPRVKRRDWGHLRVTLLHLLVVPPVQKIANCYGQELRIIDGGMPHPLAGCLVADHEARHV